MSDQFQDDEKSLGEPAATQAWVHRTFGLPNRRMAEFRNDPRRVADREDLKRVDDPDAPRFLRENPDADIHDFNRWVEHGRLRGDVATPSERRLLRQTAPRGVSRR